MVWKCASCGFSVEREGYTEICPQCYSASMVEVEKNKEYIDEVFLDIQMALQEKVSEKPN